jgi:hypothetical protein
MTWLPNFYCCPQDEWGQGVEYYLQPHDGCGYQHQHDLENPDDVVAVERWVGHLTEPGSEAELDFAAIREFDETVIVMYQRWLAGENPYAPAIIQSLDNYQSEVST